MLTQRQLDILRIDTLKDIIKVLTETHSINLLPTYQRELKALTKKVGAL